MDNAERDWLATQPPYDTLMPHKESRFPKIMAGLLMVVFFGALGGLAIGVSAAIVIAAFRWAFSV